MEFNGQSLVDADKHLRFITNTLPTREIFRSPNRGGNLVDLLRHVEHASGADHHVAHAVIDYRIFARLLHNRVENDALPWRNGINGNTRESMVRVRIKIHRGEHSSDNVKCTR